VAKHQQGDRQGDDAAHQQQNGKHCRLHALPPCRQPYRGCTCEPNLGPARIANAPMHGDHRPYDPTQRITTNCIGPSGDGQSSRAKRRMECRSPGVAPSSNCIPGGRRPSCSKEIVRRAEIHRNRTHRCIGPVDRCRLHAVDREKNAARRPTSPRIKKQPFAGGAGTYEGRQGEGINPSHGYDYRQTIREPQPHLQGKRRDISRTSPRGPEHPTRCPNRLR
jgi:hypothetical protein